MAYLYRVTCVFRYPWAIGEVHPQTDTRDKQPCTHTLRPKDNFWRPFPDSHVFRLWKEARVPGENTQTHKENSMQKDSRSRFSDTNCGMQPKE